MDFESKGGLWCPVVRPSSGRSRLPLLGLLAFAAACAGAVTPATQITASGPAGAAGVAYETDPEWSPIIPAPERIDAATLIDTASPLPRGLNAGLPTAPEEALTRHIEGPYIDSVRELSATRIKVTGWTNRSSSVDIYVDQAKLATTAVNIFRPDVANAHGLDSEIVGFQATVTVPANYQQVCAGAPQSEPATWGCNKDWLLPANLIVTYYGVPGSPVLGIIGSGNATWALQQLENQAVAFEGYGKNVLPSFEMITTVAQNYPGVDGDYSVAIPKDTLWEYLRKIREVDGVMILDFQPGRAEYMDQIPAYVDLLKQPDVHLALDPEWEMEPWQVPGAVVGSSSAWTINQVMNWLDDLIVEHDLPPKVVIVHQFSDHMITNRADLDPPDNVQLLLQMDGWGSPGLKIANYDRLQAASPILNGFKVFYGYDVPNVYPGTMMALDPQPELVSYQ